MLKLGVNFEQLKFILLLFAMFILLVIHLNNYFFFFFKTPDGPVKTSFWEAIIEHDNPRSHSLKICPKLKPDRVSPKFYQKMNVAMAFQFCLLLLF